MSTGKAKLTAHRAAAPEASRSGLAARLPPGQEIDSPELL